MALIPMGILNGFIMSSFFKDVGALRVVEAHNMEDINSNLVSIQNYVGCVFFASADQFFTASLI